MCFVNNIINDVKYYTIKVYIVQRVTMMKLSLPWPSSWSWMSRRVTRRLIQGHDDGH